MNCSDISKKYDRHSGTRQRISAIASLDDSRNTRASPDYSALWVLEISLCDRATAPHTLPKFQRNIKKMSS